MPDERGWLSTSEAAVAIDPDDPQPMTVRRRIDAYIAGDRRPYAIVGDREYGDSGQRWASPLDVERAARQRRREIAPTVTSDEYALQHEHRRS